MFVFQLPIAKEEGFFTCGHDTGEHEMQWYSRDLKFEELQNVYDYWKNFLLSKGFSAVNCYKSPMTIWMEENETLIENHQNWTEEETEFFKTKFKQEIPQYSINSVAYKLDPHLAHYGLSTHYIIARVD